MNKKQWLNIVYILLFLIYIYIGFVLIDWLKYPLAEKYDICLKEMWWNSAENFKCKTIFTIIEIRIPVFLFFSWIIFGVLFWRVLNNAFIKKTKTLEILYNIILYILVFGIIGIILWELIV